MRAWKPKHLVGFPAYLRHMGLVMRDEVKVDPRSVGIKSLIVHLGTDDRRPLEELWGADVYDTYGTNECGSLAAECAAKNGMHVFEDAFILEMIDPATGRDVPDGERGTIYQTTLFKHLAPLIRFNSNDVSAFKTGTCTCGCTHRRIDRIFGRSDNMVKLRGINLFPTGIGALMVAQCETATGDFICRVGRVDGRDSMVVHLEVRGHADPSLQARLEATLRTRLGVEIGVALCPPGSLAALTQVESRQKPIRLIDDRS